MLPYQSKYTSEINPSILHSSMFVALNSVVISGIKGIKFIYIDDVSLMKKNFIKIVIENLLII